MTIPPATLALLEALRRGDLAGSRELRLPGGLGSFPREIFGLADTLEVLDLSGGTLTALPDDLGRLHRLRALFCSGNHFERLPPVLGDCPSLSQVGFRATGMREVPGEALPPRLRWLTLTDNRIESLPAELGRRPALQKLMLSGNRLTSLPDSLAEAGDLELVRLAANRLETLPGWLTRLPQLAWLAWSGNPVERAPVPPGARAIPWRELAHGAPLGEGASGRVHRASWRATGHGAPIPVAVKLFKGAMTSDGLPEREMAACLAAGAYPGLAGAIGRLSEHPDGVQGLVMPLVPPHWRTLAGPPSLESCSRDVYEPELRLAPAAAFRIAHTIAAAVAHLHARGLLHGDLYAHNILWDGQEGAAMLTDFGAASVLPGDAAGGALQRIEVRAWGLLLGELMARCTGDLANAVKLQRLHQACIQADPRHRPSMAEVLGQLDPIPAA